MTRRARGRPPPLAAVNRQKSSTSFDFGAKKMEQMLTPEEKRFILLVERGDTASVAKTIAGHRSQPHVFDLDCVDPLGRSALSIAIMNENPEMMDLLLSEGIQVQTTIKAKQYDLLHSSSTRKRREER